MKEIGRLHRNSAPAAGSQPTTLPKLWAQDRSREKKHRRSVEAQTGRGHRSPWAHRGRSARRTLRTTCLACPKLTVPPRLPMGNKTEGRGPLYDRKPRRDLGCVESPRPHYFPWAPDCGLNVEDPSFFLLSPEPSFNVRPRLLFLCLSLPCPRYIPLLPYILTLGWVCCAILIDSELHDYRTARTNSLDLICFRFSKLVTPWIATTRPPTFLDSHTET